MSKTTKPTPTTIPTTNNIHSQRCFAALHWHSGPGGMRTIKKPNGDPKVFKTHAAALAAAQQVIDSEAV